MGGVRSLVRYHGYFVLGVVITVGLALAAIMAVFPGEDALRPLVALFAMWSGALIASWLGLAGYSVIRSGLRRRRH